MPGRYDIFGNKRVIKNQTKLKSTEWDITKEKLKIVLLIFLSNVLSLKVKSCKFTRTIAGIVLYESGHSM